MIHQPLHLVGVVAYGVVGLAALGFSAFWFCRGRTARQRLFRCLLLLMGVGDAFRGLDEWQQAIAWPPLVLSHHTVFYDIGTAVMVVAMLLWLRASMRGIGATEGEESQGPGRN